MKISRTEVHKCLIVFGGFLCYFVADGCSYSFGVVYSQALTYFGGSKYETAWMNALLYSIPQILSPLVCSIAVVFGTATLGYLGSVFLLAALVSTAFSTQIWHVYLCIGLLLGFGLESTYVAGLYTVSNAFTKRRGMAIGLATCGGGLGGLSMSTFTSFMFPIYEWKYTCLALGACFFNVAVASSLFRLYYIDLKRTKNSQPADGKVAAEQQTKSDGKDVSKDNAVVKTDAPYDSQTKANQQKSTVLQSEVYAQSSASVGGESQRILLSGSSKQSCASLRSSVSSFARKSQLLTSELLTAMSALFRKKLYTTNLNFILLCIVSFAVGFCVVTPLTYLYSHVELSLTPLCADPVSGLETEEAQMCVGLVYRKATLTVWVMSLSTCCGVLLLGSLSDRVNAVALHFCALIVICGCVLAMGLIHLDNDTYPILLGVIGLFGLAYGATYSVAFVLLIRFNGLDQFGPSLSLSLINSGLANLCGTPIGGLIYDNYNTYNPAFVLSSIVLLSALVLVVLLHLLLRYVIRVSYNMSLSEQLETTISDPANPVKSSNGKEQSTEEFYSEML